LTESFTLEQRQAISNVLTEQKFTNEQAIVNIGDSADSFYIIKEGEVSVRQQGKEIRVLKQGESFGESGLLQGNQARTMTCVALKETRILALGRELLIQMLGDKVENIIYRNMCK